MTALTDPPIGAEHALERGRQRLVVSEVGGAARSWTVDGVELLASFPPRTRDSDFAGKPLMPWPNRLRDGRYRFGQDEHQLALSEPAKHNAIHGLVRWASWSVRER